MAVETKKIFRDDLDNTELSEDTVKTVRFSFEGKAYVLDLSAENAEKVSKTFGEYIEKARKDETVAVVKPTRGRGAAPARNPETGKIREWAKEQGFQISDRGRIHQEIQDAYHADQRGEKVDVAEIKAKIEKPAASAPAESAPAEKADQSGEDAVEMFKAPKKK